MKPIEHRAVLEARENNKKGEETPLIFSLKGILVNMNITKLNGYGDVLSVKDLTEILPIGKNSVYRLLNEHKIKNIRVGNKILIPKVYLEEYLQSAN